MASLMPSVPTLAVSIIYCLWYSYHVRQAQSREKRDPRRLLRERVTFMLWQAARQMQ